MQALNAEVYALSVDRPARSLPYAKELRLPFTLLCDTGRSVLELYDLKHDNKGRIIAWPALFIIAPGGLIVYRSLDRKTHRADVAEVIRFLEQRQSDPGQQAQGRRKKRMLPVNRQGLRYVLNQFRRRKS